ncbi:hypothetical protein C7212DRAFT_296240 [Tuber magnatum]|uniref:DNA polymerase n=1 Tax=Tuber magnatum TaxID=42249 RepID=A0A317SMC4_9PEZI|nr:hypothetical protein C7212DRAFT_296240 [Tuber magnatum]
MERPRRAGTKRAPHEKLKELRELKASGMTRLSKYKVEEEEDLYEVVDEEEYKKVVRQRLDQDDFVVDDRGEGYADNGMDDWDDHHRREGSWEESGDERLKKGGKSAKVRKAEEQKRKGEQEGNIRKFFNSNNAPSIKPKPKVKEENLDFMTDLLGEFDNDSPVEPISLMSKKPRGEPVKKVRRLSPPLKDSKPVGVDKTRHAEGCGGGAGFTSSPPPMAGNTDNGDQDYGSFDEDVDMGDAPVAPSSPIADAVKRKHWKEDDEDEDEGEDDLAVAQIQGSRSIKIEAVNIVASRPAPKGGSVKQGAIAPNKPVATIDPTAWALFAGGDNVTSSPALDGSDLGKLGPGDVVGKDGSIEIFWLDYTEVRGSLCLFGKVQDKKSGKYVSAFLKIDKILRNLYFLPRETRHKGKLDTGEVITMENVHEEIAGIMEQNEISWFMAKSSQRKYAFELPGIPKEGDYLKVLYPYTDPQLPSELTGQTFSCVFGTNTALFEQFVLCRNIMGPCWLKVEGANFTAVENSSWCKLEIQVGSPQQVTAIGDADSSEPPPLTLMSIALRTHMNVKDNKQEIIAISCRIYENISLNDANAPEKLPCQLFSVVRPINPVYPADFGKLVQNHKGTISPQRTESMLLSTFLAKLHQIDPDVLVGHQLEGVDYGILLHRMKERMTTNWHQLGRMKRSTWPQYGGRMAGSFFAERQLVSGRLICDLANELGKSLTTQCQSWSLTEMCDLILGDKRQDLDNAEALRTWATTGRGLLDYVRHCEADTYFIAAIALKIQIVPLAKQLTNLAGNSWARTMSGTRAERNEYILLHEFHRNKYICPDKVYGKGNIAQKTDGAGDEGGNEGGGAKKKEKYKGGLVFDPEKGLYDKFILVMDFNSLYPSIIQEFNICFTTVERDDSAEEKVPDVPETQALGILPRLISTLVRRRRIVKDLMKDRTATDVQRSQWDIKQQALKLTANSMYGCLGYTRSRFYARPLAMLTTHKGREILRSTKELAETINLRVIYGDTDSVMINTGVDNYADAVKIGTDFKRKVNEQYKLLEIDIDNVFQRLLLHAKKKYAAINYVEINGKLATKLELSKDASSHILAEIFSGDDTEVVVGRIHEYLRGLAEKVRENAFPLMKYIIYTKLGKSLDEYGTSLQAMPQVQVALRKKARGEPVKSGDVVSYVITGGEGSEAPDKNVSDRAYAPQDIMKADSGLKPDAEWYLIKQIFPPIERLCGPIEGTDAMRLAECLGLDTRKYQITNAPGQEDRLIHPLESTIPDEERFKDAVRLQLQCRACGESFQFEGPVLSYECCSHDGIVCKNTSCNRVFSVPSIVAQVECQIRQLTSKYYEAWLVCDDASCGNRTRQMNVYGKRCLGPNRLADDCRGVMRYEYTDKMLYNQLLYFSSLFNAGKAIAKLKDGSEEHETIKASIQGNQGQFEAISNVVQKYLDKCGRRWVSMDSIFTFSVGI